MDLRQRNNVTVKGDGPGTLVFAHGFGCDQHMWRRIVPALTDRWRVVLYDLTGSGASDLSAYDRDAYATLHGHACDALAVVEAFAHGPTVFVGHSVSAMIGLLATIEAPERFAGQAMIGPSPCYVDDGAYVGGFSRADVDELLEALERNYLGWASSMAPAIMGAPEQPQLGQELAASFCRTDPAIAQHFARVTFLSDHRADAPRSTVPALIVQCSDDFIAPRAVGDWLHRSMPGSMLRVVDNVGHCPHLSAPSPTSQALEDFLRAVARPEK